MASPPKPWERNGASPPTTTTMTTPTGASSPAIPTLSSPSNSSPVIPPRPDSLATTVNQNASAYSRLGNNGYGAAYGQGGYGQGAYGSAYSSPYSRMGSYGGYGGMSGMGAMGGMGGMGGMGSMYGGGMYGGGMYGGGMGGMGMDPNNPSLAQRFGNSTQATFQMLEGVVGTFGGFAQMLESTYMATHSSFFAMVSVAEQFGNLRDTLGSVLGVFTLMRWIRTLIAKITGRPPPVDAVALTPAAFAHFEGRQAPLGPNGAPVPAKPSRKPLIFFLLAAFGLPYLMGKAIRSMAANVEEEERKKLEMSGQNMDPTKLEFCRVLYDFTPDAGNATQGVDLAVKKGDFIAVLSKADPLGNPSEWWRCRARDGRLGYLPSTFLEVAKRPGQPVAAIKAPISEPDTSRTSSMTSASQPPPIPGKMGDISAESFQKSQFYS
ncbi:peroxin-13 [Microdochium nivale]|nr:peroxin-13 [Microdochium nivale]